MKVIKSFNEIPPLKGPISLTIGVFDGLHLGHQAILKQLHKETRKGGTRVALTFSNPPSTYLRPSSPVPLLMTLNHRLELFNKLDIDLVIVLPFDAQFANQSYEEFFKTLRTYLPFDHLTVGDDARFGKERAGGPNEIKALGFDVTYLPKESYHKEPISSGVIRSYLEKGELKKVKRMLGRPYSLRLPFDSCNVTREDEVQYKWVSGIDKVCLLPSAVYAVDIQTEGKKIPAIAFYRGSQNIYKVKELSLSLIFEKELLPADEIEITFISYLHNELDSETAAPSRANLLETLKPEFFPS